jgi:hypothetical protein
MTVCLYSCLWYTACKSHLLCAVLYCHLRLYHIFPHYVIHGTIFGKKLLEIKCVLIFSANLSEKFLILRVNQ